MAVAFLSITGSEVKVISISENPDAIDKIASRIPEVIDKISGLISKDKQEKAE